MKTGFTIVEILVALGIFGLVMIAGTAAYVYVIQSANKATSLTEVRSTADTIMADIESEVKKAGSYRVNFPDFNSNPPSDLKVNLTTYSDKNCSSLLTTYAIDSNQKAYSITKTIGSGTPVTLQSAKTAIVDCHEKDFTCGKLQTSYYCQYTCGDVDVNSCGAGFVPQKLDVSTSTLYKIWDRYDPNACYTDLFNPVLYVQQNPGPKRSDLCASIQLSGWVEPRN